MSIITPATSIILKFILLFRICSILPSSSLSINRRSAIKTSLISISPFLPSPNNADAAAQLSSPLPPPITSPSYGQSYIPPLTPPLNHRATYRYSLGRNTYALEQLLTFFNVTATIRTTVIKLNDNNDLWVHSPQWPTGEYCHLLDEIGMVKHIVLPCNALEHKAPMRAFCNKYPAASVWISPGQYGPFGTCDRDVSSCRSMNYRVDGVLYESSSSPPLSANGVTTRTTPPWSDEFEFRTLSISLPGNAGPVTETAFFHKASRTLVTTDAVVYIPELPSPILSTYFSRDVLDGEGFWPRTVLQAIFLPLRTDDEGDDYPSYRAITNRLIRAPILRGFVDARAPREVRDWIREVEGMGDFDRIVTSHFASPIDATPNDWRGAFDYLDGGDGGVKIQCRDWELLKGLNDVIGKYNLGAPQVFDFTSGCV